MLTRWLKYDNTIIPKHGFSSTLIILFVVQLKTLAGGRNEHSRY